MKYTIENDKLKISVNSMGAELCSVICKEDGVEHIWEGDPAVWRGQAPILFPYTGRVPNGQFSVKGKVFEGKPHGIARQMEHTMIRCEGNLLVLELKSNPETLEKWPFHFRLQSKFLLDGDSLLHTLCVENSDQEEITFGIGFHPGFAVPFDKAHTHKDYVLRFEKMESPLCLDTSCGGLLSGKTYYLGKNMEEIPIDEQLFANGSHLMIGLHSETLGIYEKDSGRGVVCTIGNAPYNLIWSAQGAPRFVCIEPWQSTPSPATEDITWENKPAAACIAPGGKYTITMRTRFVR